jgi:hypothetical protein
VKPPKAPKSPCEACPRFQSMLSANWTPPSLAPSGQTRLTVVIPSSPDPAMGRGPAVAPVDVMRALFDAGLSANDVAIVPVTRCQGEGSTIKKAAARCVKKSRIEGLLTTGLHLVVGRAAFGDVVDDPTLRFNAFRGTWCSVGDFHAFPVVHPSDIMKEVVDPVARESHLARMREDVGRCVDRVLDRETGPAVDIQIFDSPLAAREYLTVLGRRTAPWTFDIETYDFSQYPGRREVATDPFHPDFRLRGVAIATSKSNGAWIELKGWDGNAEARAVLDQAFGSPAPKWAFNGHFDASGLVYGGTVTAVVNRSGDGMLAGVTLSDGTHESLRLEKLVLERLKMPMGWAVDKSRMRDLSTDAVARGAVTDACRTHELCEVEHADLARRAGR